MPTRISVPLVAPVLLVAAVGVAGYSVVRYHPAIVVTYLLAAVALALHLWSGPRPTGRRDWAPGLSAGLAVTGVLTWLVPGFTYLAADRAAMVRGLLAGACVTSAAVLVIGRRRAGDVALAIAVTGYLAASAVLIRGDPAPPIDVWYTLQGAADALADGRNIYDQVWLGPPGVMAAFTYLPWTAVLLAPGRWLAGDVRYALVAVTVVAALTVRYLPGRRSAEASDPLTGTTRGAAAGAAALLMLLPGTATQVEQAWTEPLLLAGLAGAAWALSRGRMTTAIVLLALGMACKQHMALLLPILAAWPRYGLRRAALTATGTVVLLVPWLLADARAFLDDTVFLLVRFPPMRFADSLYLLVVNQWSWLPPFWLTGAVVLATIGAVSWRVRRDDPDVAVWLRWAALVLLVANLVNKQAFYNQYWLVAAVVVTSWAVDSATTATTSVRSVSEPGSGGEAAVQAG